LARDLAADEFGAETGVAMSWRPAITSVGFFDPGNSARWSSVLSASQQVR